MRLVRDQSLPPHDLRSAALRSLLIDAFHSVQSGEAAVLTETGWTRDPDTAPMRLVVFWWSGNRYGPAPVYVFIDTASVELHHWEVPDESVLPEHVADRFDRDCGRMEREMAKGVRGKMLRRFHLRDLSQVEDFIRGSLEAFSANPEQTH